MIGIPLWKLGATAGVILALVGSCALRDRSIEQRGAQKVVAASKEVGKANEQKARKAHDRAAAPGAPRRVLEQFCRDCN